MAVVCGGDTLRGCDTLRLLSTSSGAQLVAIAIEGGMRATPGLAPWNGMLWVASHGRRLSVHTPQGHCFPCASFDPYRPLIQLPFGATSTLCGLLRAACLSLGPRS